MSKERLYLFDTTLRDGAQTQGVDFSVEDKRHIAKALDVLGIDYVEGGWPGANPTDTAFFAQAPALDTATFTAFGMTRRPGRSAENDPGLSDLINSGAPAVCIVGKAWDFHVDVALGVPREENVDAIASSIAHIKASGREPMFDAEHFFDGWKANTAYTLECVMAAYEAGARWVVLCDTNGGTLPHEVHDIVFELVSHIPGERLGIHAHNDTGNAVSNSLAAVHAGVRQVQGTLNGLGERCGNANMISLIPSFVLKPPFADTVETGISADQLASLSRVSRMLDEVLNRQPNRHAPYVGASAFAHKGGLHASAVEKDPKTYEHIDPALVGNERHVLVSNQSGKSNVLSRLDGLGIAVDPKDPKVGRLLDAVKDREFQGYSYDGAEASFELLARRTLGQVPSYFKVEKFKVEVERRYDARGELKTVSEASVKLDIDGHEVHSVAEGEHGPINALDVALRKDLGKYSDLIAGIELADFKVRILQTEGAQGTASVTRVMIESKDETGARWFTVGVSDNIVDASFQALVDSITYKLFKSGAKV